MTRRLGVNTRVGGVRLSGLEQNHQWSTMWFWTCQPPIVSKVLCVYAYTVAGADTSFAIVIFSPPVLYTPYEYVRTKKTTVLAWYASETCKYTVSTYGSQDYTVQYKIILEDFQFGGFRK
jgi:hypothetical protein